MLAKVRGLPWRLDEKRGKGSHVTLYFGERMTVVRNPKDELKTVRYMPCASNFASGKTSYEAIYLRDEADA
jgi:hypothetical protein